MSCRGLSFLCVNGTLVVQLINFAIFFAVLNVVFLRPVGAAIARRREYIKSLVSDYDQYQAEAQSLRAEAEAVRVAARREAEHRLATARAGASNEAAAISTDYASRAQTVVEDAQRTAQAEFDAARASESETVGKLVELVLQRIVPESAQ
jgi:F-type H+-transporting ATPase subunit b